MKLRCLIYNLELLFFIHSLTQHFGWVARTLDCVDWSTPLHRCSGRRWMMGMSRTSMSARGGCFCVFLVVSRRGCVLCEFSRSHQNPYGGLQFSCQEKVDGVTPCPTLSCTIPWGAWDFELILSWYKLSRYAVEGGMDRAMAIKKQIFASSFTNHT